MAGVRDASHASRRAWLQLIRAPGLGPALGRRLLEAFGGPEAAVGASRQQWQARGFPEPLFAALQNVPAAALEADLSWLQGRERHLLSLDDADYPPRLREISHPPLALFVQGDRSVLTEPQLAIVGARAATPQGERDAEAFAAALVRNGLVVTSGLAQGIDGAAHRGALSAGGRSIAVCGTGLDRVYPARHRELARELALAGALVSEFPPGTPPLAEHFPRRNRIISGLALGVLVVEAAPRSGSLITAQYAAEQGREVFAVPGSIHAPLARGCHTLIRQGAKLTERPEDILEELAPLRDNGLATPPLPEPTAEPVREGAHQKVLQALGFEAVSFDILLERSGLSLDALASALLDLELQGDVATLPGGSYQRIVRSSSNAF